MWVCASHKKHLIYKTDINAEKNTRKRNANSYADYGEEEKKSSFFEHKMNFYLFCTHEFDLKITTLEFCTIKLDTIFNEFNFSHYFSLFVIFQCFFLRWVLTMRVQKASVGFSFENYLHRIWFEIDTRVLLANGYETRESIFCEISARIQLESNSSVFNETNKCAMLN